MSKTNKRKIQLPQDLGQLRSHALTGTHKGPFMGMSGTGKRVDVNLIDIIRFGDDGRAREHWGLVDQLAMMQQLGAIPAGPAT